MPALHIERMQLDVPGLTEAQARDLAHRVAVGLANATGLPNGASSPAIRLDLAAGSADDMSGLAEQIVAATIRAIGHASAGGP